MPRPSIKLLKSASELHAWRQDVGTAPLHLVPTMGALHAGHDSLCRAALAPGARSLVSIFVNPLQFERPDDLARYPRHPEEDAARLAALGIDAVYLPDVNDMYPCGSAIKVDPGPVGSRFEGAARPGHFAGMLTVVHKLFQRCRPTRAFFGEKDAQQLFLVRRMVAELELGPEVVACPIVREADGLALSSRNVQLSPTGRQRALALSQGLQAAAAAYAAGAREPEALRACLRQPMAAAEIDIAYAELVEEATFERVKTAAQAGPWRALVAGRVDGVHLLDNVCLA